MTLTTNQIKKKPHTDKRTVETVLEGSGCFLITEPHPSKSKRFEMRMRYPFNKNGKMIYIPLGVWDKDIKSTEDAISKTQTIKNWSKINNQNPTNAAVWEAHRRVWRSQSRRKCSRGIRVGSGTSF